MMPHCHWLQNYILKCVPIKLTDNTIVYSAGVGSVVFEPVIDGKSSQAVKFSNILHVPELRNNLLSILYLTHHSRFVVHINVTHMSFSHSTGPPLFVASINNHNAAFLDGMTVYDPVCIGCDHCPTRFGTLALPIRAPQHS